MSYLKTSILAFILIISIANAITLPTGDNAELTLLPGTDEHPLFQYRGTEINAEIIETDSGNFVNLDFNSAGIAGELGSPQLPVLHRIIQIPFDCSPRIRVQNIETVSYNLLDFGIVNQIIPRQAPIPKIRGYEPEFELAEDVYDSDRYIFERKVEIIDVQIARNYRIALLEIRPVNYNPATGDIEVIQSMEFGLEFPGADISETRRIKERYSSKAYDTAIKPLIANPHAWEPRWLPDVNALGYLIITGSSYTAGTDELAHWKSRKGYSVKVRTATSLGGTTTGIRNWILAEYDTATIAPTFVLLIGDVGDVPRYTGSASGSATDTPYGNMDGSGYIPELFVGRISPDNVTQFNHFIDRIIDYEHYNIPSGHDDFPNKACFLASDDPSYWSLAEATHRYAVQTHFGPAGFTCDTIKAHSDPLAGIHAIQAINDGRMIVNYSGHGGYYSWEAPEMDASDVEGLTNYGEYPFVISNACITGSYHLSECFGETWIRQMDKGAIGFLGASNNSYWDEDDEMERRMYDDTFGDEYYFMAGMMLRSLYGVYLEYSSSANYYYDIYNLLGDPSVALWFRAPNALSASHPSTIGISENVSVNVTSGGSPVSDALVCITNDENVHSVGYTNSSGNVTLGTMGSDVGDTLWVTATAYNKIPYEGVIVVGGSGPWLSIDDVTTDDPDGDNDDIIDIGEDIDFTIALTNTGSEDASSVTGRLRSANPAVTRIDSVKSYGNINVGAVVSNGTPFVCQFAPSLGDGEIVQMTLFANDPTDTSWNLNFTVEIASPMTAYNSHSIDDPAGDGDHYAEPGEDIELEVNIENNGGETARFMMLALTTSDPYLTITSSSSGIDSISPGGVKTCNSPFELSIDAGCPTPRLAQVIISAADYRGPTSVDTFGITIGQAGFADDCESGSGGWDIVSHWNISTRRRNTPTHAWYSGIDGLFMHHDTTDAILITPVIITPDTPRLTFWHYYFTEHSYDSCFVDYSTDGGSSWYRLGGYNGPAGNWEFGYHNLSTRAITPGEPIEFRFTQTADTYVHAEGWYIDDISLQPADYAYAGAGQVDPTAGNTAIEFHFRVTIASPASYAPSNVRVFIDGTPYSMSFTGEGDLTDDGVIYEYSTYLPVGSHNYHFEFNTASTSYRYPQSGEIDGPFVSAPFYEFDIGYSASGLTPIGERDDWEYGTPSYGPSSVPIGTNCWATNINGDYSDSSKSRLVLGELDLSEIEAPFLCFYHWYRNQGADTPMFHDGCNVKISTDGDPANAFIVHPQYGYDGTASQYNHFVDWQTVYGDDDIGNFWQFEAIDLTPWSGETVTVYFDFGSSSANTEAGWYINNVYLLGAETIGVIGDQTTEKPDRIALRAHPNPFNSVVELEILNQPEGHLELKIYDIAGRLVDDLSSVIADGEKTIRWDAAGRPGGIYFARLKAGKKSASIPIIYLK